GKTRFPGTDVETFVKLRRVASHYFSVKPLGEPHSKCRLARSRRPYYGHKRQKRLVLIHGNRRWRARTNRKISTNKKRRRLPRTCWRASFTSVRSLVANYSST